MTVPRTWNKDNPYVEGDMLIKGDLTVEGTQAFTGAQTYGGDASFSRTAANKFSVASGDTWNITTADKLTVADIIVPVTLYWHFRVGPHASVTEYDLAIALRAFTVTAISVVPSTLQGGALTATVVKATGTSAPVKTTTPLHAADAINLNTGAYTVQTITLTATTADLTFAAGDRLGIDYSAALTAGHAVVTVGIKYV